MALKAHPDVFDALVVGVPDERYGQRVAAVVHAAPGTDPTLAELDAFLRHAIAGYKVPRKRWWSTRFPRNAAGKPDYRWAKDTTEERPADDAHANHASGTTDLMRTELCDRFGIEYPIFAFTPSETSPRRSARPAASACSAASGSTTPRSSRAC